MIDKYQNELLKSKIYSTLKSKCNSKNDSTNYSVMKIVNDVVFYSCERSKTIITYMPEYTLHDETHLFRVLYLMDRIIPTDTLGKLSIPELMMLILVSFLHDIGMAPTENDIKAWKGIWTDDEPSFMETEAFNKFRRFRNTYPHKIIEIDRFNSDKLYSKAQIIEDFIITEYIRSTHAIRAREVIAQDWSDKIYYEDKNLTHVLAQLCFSHSEDALSLLELETNVLCGENEYICLPFIGVMIRLADVLDFDAKRTPSVLFSHLSVRNPVSLKEWQKHRAVQSWVIKPDKIAFHAVCSHPAIEKSINDFCNEIDKELLNCTNVLSRIEDNFRDDTHIYKISLPSRVDRRKIQPEVDIKTNEPLYLYKDTTFELSKDQIIDLLMGTKLYDDTKSALRELIQNSIDACLVSKALCANLKILYSPEILVRYFSEGSTDVLEVEDNGIGMNQAIIDKYYSKVGSSYYKSKDFYDLKAQTGLTFHPISRFGIGILSCFMVSDSIEVDTRKLLDNGDKDKPLSLTIEGFDSIFTIKNGERISHGTRTKLYLRHKDNPWDKIRSDDFIKYVKDSIPNPPVPITIVTDHNENSSSVINQDTFSLISPNILKNYHWQEDQYVRTVEISLNNDIKGLRGSAIVAIMENDDIPVSIIDGLKRTVEIDGDSYILENRIALKINEIEKISTGIEVNIESGIDTHESTDTILKSKSKFSIHGIDFPPGLFPEYYDRNKPTKFRWCLPILMVLDIFGSNDLDLNSARTEIIYNEKWNNFEADLAAIIATELKKSFSQDYWDNLRDLIMLQNCSQIFIEAFKNN